MQITCRGNESVVLVLILHVIMHNNAAAGANASQRRLQPNLVHPALSHSIALHFS